jgi:hypothetical protein
MIIRNTRPQITNFFGMLTMPMIEISCVLLAGGRKQKKGWGVVNKKLEIRTKVRVRGQTIDV